jgi:hypothetical protein
MYKGEVVRAVLIKIIGKACAHQAHTCAVFVANRTYQADEMAVVASTTPWHQSALIGATAESPVIPTLRVDAGDRPDIVHRLDTFREAA